MRIMLVEDDATTAEAIAISLGLGWPDCDLILAENGTKAISQMIGQGPDLVLLDINLPDMDGFEVCNHIRKYSGVPIIMLTARDMELDKVKGLECGADDYITKPFGHLELLARIKALLRRTDKLQPIDKGTTFKAGDLTIDLGRRQVWQAGKLVNLTPTEYNLLYHLTRHAGQTLSHQFLLVRVWGEEYKYEIEYIKVYIRRLRNKLESDPQQPRFIVTDWGVGYRFEIP